MILAGQVLVEGRVMDKPGMRVSTGAAIQLKARPRYVSRGGSKLEAALQTFATSVQGATAADIGASTGGFTDCLLQHGASRVYSIDVGYGQLAWTLRRDQRVVVMERTNARYLTELPEPLHLATIDVSFISLKLVLPAVRQLVAPDGEIIVLIKPQFEAGRRKVRKGGVVRDPAVHRAVLLDVLGWAVQHGFEVRGLMRSPLLGPAGNVEFLAHLQPTSSTMVTLSEDLIERCVPCSSF
jgi:23S rRNA (cytidine1920-2'-O)/16S rRNA (cytidine1409-2'-O)-methyltransferase